MKRRRLAPPSRLLSLILGASLALPGCMMLGGSPMAATSMAGGSMGIAGGGSQDIALARELIRQGQVPMPGSFVVEGLYAEHDLPLGQAPAGKTLHVDFGLGQAPALPEGKPTTFVQVAMSSGLAQEDFQRPALSLTVVADRSGSMADGKMEALKHSLRKLVDRLDAQDRLAIVVFDDQVETWRELAPVEDKQAIHRLIDRLEPRGSTDIELGMRRGYEILAAAAQDTRDRRLMLFTDALPNTGTTDDQSFEALVKRYSEQGIGLTAFGIGLDFGTQLAETIGNQQGGNYVFLKDANQVNTLFDEDFDYLVSPAAYDMQLSLTPAAGMRLVDVYGAGTWESTDQAYRMSLKTLFFSRRRGALVLRLEPTASGSVPASGSPLVMGSLTYTERDRVTKREEAVSAQWQTAPSASDVTLYSPAKVQKAVALTNMFLAMREASKLYHAQPRQAEAAAAVATASRQELEAAAAALNDPALSQEAELMGALAENCRR